MKKLFQFYLEGDGFLENIVHTEDSMFVCIRVLQLSRDLDVCLLDEVVLNCEVPPTLFADLKKLESKYMGEGRLIVHFQAKYIRFGSFFAGMTPEDPDHMLQLHCQLQRIEENMDDSQKLHLNSDSVDESVAISQ